MPMVFPQTGPGFPQQQQNPSQNPALDALRALGALNATDSGSNGPLNPHRLTEANQWGQDGNNPPPATPPNQVPTSMQMLQSLRMSRPPSIMTKLKGPASLQNSDQESRTTP